jgi:hypothetical protein
MPLRNNKWIAILLLPLSSSLAEAQPHTMSGVWDITGSKPTSCTFNQTGEFFRGTCTSGTSEGIAFGIIPDENNTPGRVRVLWTWNWTFIDDSGSQVIAVSGMDNFAGEQDGGLLTGSRSGSNGNGGFAATRRNTR